MVRTEKRYKVEITYITIKSRSDSIQDWYKRVCTYIESYFMFVFLQNRYVYEKGVIQIERLIY